MIGTRYLFALLFAVAVPLAARADGALVAQHSADCSSYTTAGALCFDTTKSQLYVGDGTATRPAAFDNFDFFLYQSTSPASQMNGKLMSLVSANVSSEGSSGSQSEVTIPLGTSQAYVRSLLCIVQPFVGYWDAGADDFTFQLTEYDATHGTGAGVAVGSPVSTPSTMTVGYQQPAAENVLKSTINAMTTLTGGGHYLAIKMSAVDANVSLTMVTARCTVRLALPE